MSVIIRVIYEGTTYDLDIQEDIPLRLDVSAIENTSIGETFGIGSQTFNLPGTKNNNKFFKHAYNIGAEDIPSFSNTIDGRILSKGETLLKGQFQLLEIVKDEAGYVVYKCQMADETVQFKDAIQNKLIKNADWSSYSHELTTANITGSWRGELLDGKVYYPLAHYGYNDPESQGNYPNFAFGEPDGFGNITGNFINNIFTPIQPQQFLPAIRAKEVIDRICEQAGFTADGSFINSGNFSNLMILPKGKEELGITIDNIEQATGYATANYNQSITIGSTNEELVANSVIVDPQGKFFTSGSEGYGYYLADGNGEYEVSAQIGFFNPMSFSQGKVEIKLTLMRGSFPTAGGVISENTIELSSLDGFNTFYLNTGGSFNSSTSEEVWAWISYTAVEGTPTSNLNLFGFSTRLAVNKAPEVYNGATVDMGLQWPSDLKSVDLLTALIQQFNLVVYPSKDRDKTIIFEQFDDWIRSGKQKDWTEKWNTAIRTSINHTVDEEPQELIIGNEDDSDRFSVEAKESDPYFQYGTLRILADNNVSQGSKSIKNPFGPTVLGGPLVSGSFSSEGVPTNNIDLGSSFAFPHLYKFDNNQIKSYKFRPRLGYKSNNSFPSGSDKHKLYIGTSNEDSQLITSSYGTLSNVNGLPALDNAPDLHFNNTYFKFAGPGLNLGNTKSNFDTYWKTYIDSLYWDGNRKVTLDVKFEPQEFQDLELNDIIFIKDQQYRINKIEGFNLTNEDVVTVELIRLYPAYYQNNPDCDFEFTVDKMECDFTFEAIAGVTPPPTPTPAPVTPTPTPTPTPTLPPGPTPTPTPGPGTPTPTPEPTPAVFSYTGLYAYGSYQNACSSSNQTTIYTQGPIGTGSIAYEDASLLDVFDFARFFIDNETGIGYEFVDPNTTGQVIDTLDDACNIAIYTLYISFNEYDACAESVVKTVYAEPGDLIENGTTLYEDINLQFTWDEGYDVKFIVSGSEPRQIYYNVNGAVSQSGTDICYTVNQFNGWDSTASTPPPATCGDYDEVFYVQDIPQVGDNIFTDPDLTDTIFTGEKFVYNDDRNELYTMSGSTGGDGSGWVIGTITSDYCTPATPTPSPTPAPIVTPFTASYAYSSWDEACNNPAGTSILYRAEIWNGISPAGYETYIYEDAALTNIFDFYVYVVDTETGIGYEMPDPNTTGKVVDTYNDICNPNQVTIHYSFNEFEACAGTLVTTKYIDPDKQWGDVGVILYDDFDRTQVFSTVANEYVSTSSLDRSIYEYSGGVLVDTGVDCYTPSFFNGSDYTSTTQPTPTCGTFEKNLYTKNTPQIGSVIYTNATYTDPISTGNNWVYNDSANELYQMGGNPSVGEEWVIQSIITNACTPPPTPSPTPNVQSYVMQRGYDNVSQVCGTQYGQQTVYTNGPIAVGKVLYEDATLNTNVDFYNYYRDINTDITWRVSTLTGEVLEQMTFTCPTPTPTPTPEPTATPIPTATPVPPTPTPGPAQTYTIEFYECPNYTTAYYRNWTGDINQFDGNAVYYDANLGLCLEPFYIVATTSNPTLDESEVYIDCPTCLAG